MLEFRIPDLERMAVLGRALADCLREDASLRCILLRGDLGSGKTTLARFLVEALPGGERAEISSPSFTLCNIYPTEPPVLHCDLYRVGGAVPGELSETLDAGDMAALVEWAEHLPIALRPQDFLDISLKACDEYRIVRVEIHSRNSARAEFLLRATQSLMSEHPMKILVQKFGGTSVADLECQKKVREKVLAALGRGYKMVVVLSARAGETNQLLALADEWSKTPDLTERDNLVSIGEQISVALFAMLLKDAGVKARSVLAFQIPLITSDEFSDARILSIDSGWLRAELEKHDVLVVAGFQGVTDAGRITTLGRGGSDTSAVALAAALQAEECEIYTDVDGVYTTDPRVCSQARKMRTIAYDEMLELASMGAKVLHIRSVEFAKKYKVPVHVRSTFTDIPGTLVTQEDSSMEAVLVSGIAYDKDQARVTMRGVPDTPGVAATIFGALSEGGVLVDMIVQNTSRDGITDMTFTVARKDLTKTLDLVRTVSAEIKCQEVLHDTHVAKVSAIGVGMRNHSGVAARAFAALRKENINILMISTSEIKISILIEEKYVELAVRILHEEFGLDWDMGE